MTPLARIFSIVVGNTLILLAAYAEPAGEGATGSPDQPDNLPAAGHIRSEVIRAVREDAAAAGGVIAVQPTAAPTEAPSDVVAMDRVIVQGQKLPTFRRTRETRVEEFFRTGNFYQNVGKKVTTRLWMKGDKGLMVSFDW